MSTVVCGLIFVQLWTERKTRTQNWHNQGSNQVKTNSKWKFPKSVGAFGGVPIIENYSILESIVVFP